ncbi:beta-glucoside-specific PTS transporter subunit IIABC [Erwinia sp. INIA-01]|uniref:beta-glucoside-specific PTS transporter subunit IIABC n=1 Tax=Erwinia sp. INIA01 TaxID=2991500 RepID=UPI0022242664|nr:beta-glucoside-specific PTS transporter subunit IIABC [Erwinia sp. INIA01]MCW1874215.1 beta-glucoside-specific PTS transporter subunit IIABC [Erwinia sp. INIA01]
MDYKQLAHQILSLGGGKNNISRLTHCATRLRMEFNDRAKVDAQAIEKLPGVIGVVESGGQFQIVVGNQVQQTYRTLMSEIGTLNAQPASGNTAAKKSGIFSQIISVISTTFTPVIPAITGAGMIKALLAILKLCGLISASSTTYQLLDTIADAAFFFLPVLLAYGAAIKFACSPILAMTIAGALLHPNLAQMLAKGGDITFIGIDVRLADYAGSVLPIIFTVWLMSWVERFAEKVSPSMLVFFIKPMIVLLVTAPLALVVVGPFGILLNDLVAAGAAVINGKASWLIPMLMGGLQPFLVITGTAWAMTPIATAQLTRQGFETINGPGMLASNIAQGAATLCVALKTKNKDLKQLASSAGFTALLGITEPSLYGVTLKLKRPLIAAMIGGGCAGIYAGLSGVVRYAFVSPGLAALPAFIGDNPMNIVHALITCAIAIVVTFALTWFLGFDDPQPEGGDDLSPSDGSPSAIATPVTNTDTPAAHPQKSETLRSPLSGRIVPLSSVPDDVFSLGLLGQGVAIIPDRGVLLSPVTGEVVTFLPSKHAVGIKSNEGAEILIHIGIDTVNLAGQYFTSSLQVGDRVSPGDELVSFDLAAIIAAGYDPITPVLVVNSEEYRAVEALADGQIATGADLLALNSQHGETTA